MLIVFPSVDSPASPVALPRRLVSLLRVRDCLKSSCTRYALVLMLVRHPAVNAVKRFQETNVVCHYSFELPQTVAVFRRTTRRSRRQWFQHCSTAPQRHPHSCLFGLRRTKKSDIGVPAPPQFPKGEAIGFAAIAAPHLIRRS